MRATGVLNGYSLVQSKVHNEWLYVNVEECGHAGVREGKEVILYRGQDEKTCAPEVGEGGGILHTPWIAITEEGRHIEMNQGHKLVLLVPQLWGCRQQ